MQRRSVIARAAIGSVALTAAALTAAQTATAHDDGGHDEAEYRATLRTLNASGVTGEVRLTAENGKVEVELKARGLETGDTKVHMSHIHGFGKDGQDATCPKMSDDPDGGVLTFFDGLPFYGPVLVTLGHDTQFPDGRLEFERTYDMTDAGGAISTLGPLDHYVVVVHGLSVPAAGKEGDTKYDASTPVACAVINTH